MQRNTNLEIDILHVLTFYGTNGEYGGPMSVALNITSKLTDLRLNSRIICGSKYKIKSSETEIESLLAIPVKSLVKKFHFSSMWSLKMGLNLCNEIKKSKIVHIHFARDLIPVVASLICLVKRKSYVVQTHGMISNQSTKFQFYFDKFITKSILRNAEIVFCLNLNEVSKLNRFKLSNTKILGNGIEIPFELDLKHRNSHLKVIFFSRIEKRKNLKCFIEVAELCQAFGLNYSFEIYGPDGGNLKPNLDLIERLGLSNIVYCGSVPIGEAQSLLSTKDVLILPSFDEPWAMVVLEALSVGTKIIIFPSSGIASIIQIAFPEFISAAENSLAVFQSLVQNDGLLSEKDRLKISHFCAENFSISAVIKRYLNMLGFSQEINFE